MGKKHRKDLYDVVQDVGKYPPEAYRFVEEGLSYTVQETHGEMSESQRDLHAFLSDNEMDLDQFEMMYLNDELPEEVRAQVDAAGGLEELNRHVTGQNLCWGLRNYALKRWGALASAVLNHWNIRRTRDFGEIVFALVNHNFLQKQPHDKLEDFNDVYAFEEALDRAFRIDLRGLSQPTNEADATL